MAGSAALAKPYNSTIADNNKINFNMVWKPQIIWRECTYIPTYIPTYLHKYMRICMCVILRTIVDCSEMPHSLICMHGNCWEGCLFTQAHMHILTHLHTQKSIFLRTAVDFKLAENLKSYGKSKSVAPTYTHTCTHTFSGELTKVWKD